MPETKTDPEHIAISKSKGVTIDWKDGHQSVYTLASLRDQCPCATCTGAHGNEPKPSEYSKPADATPFQMFQPALKMIDVEPVGQYALRIHWSDGHNSGIYSWEHLRSICSCEACRAACVNLQK